MAKNQGMPKKGEACVIPTCTLRDRAAFYTEKSFIFKHCFPLDNECQFDEWLRVVRDCREDATWTPTKKDVICSRHFELGHYFSKSNSSRKLADSAVPCLNLPPHVPPQISSVGNTVSTSPTTVTAQISTTNVCTFESKMLSVNISPNLNCYKTYTIRETSRTAKQTDSEEPKNWRDELDETEDLKVQEMEMDDDQVGEMSYPLIVQGSDTEDERHVDSGSVLDEEVPLHDPLALTDEDGGTSASSSKNALSSTNKVVVVLNKVDKMVISCSKCQVKVLVRPVGNNKINENNLNKINYICPKCVVQKLSPVSGVNFPDRCSEVLSNPQDSSSQLSIAPTSSVPSNPNASEPFDKNGNPLMVRCIATFCQEKFFEWSSRLIQHLTKHYPARADFSRKSFVCRFCSRKAINPYRLRVHELETHKEMLTHSCHICSHQYSSEELLETHLMIHLPKGPFKCLICRKVFNSHDAFEGHLFSHISKPKKVLIHTPSNCKSVSTQAALVPQHVEEVARPDDEDLGVAALEIDIEEAPTKNTDTEVLHVSKDERRRKIPKNCRSVMTQAAIFSEPLKKLSTMNDEDLSGAPDSEVEVEPSVQKNVLLHASKSEASMYILKSFRSVKTQAALRQCEDDELIRINEDDLGVTFDTDEESLVPETMKSNSTELLNPSKNIHLICQICGKTSPNLKEHVKHGLLHKRSTPKNFKCELCPFSKYHNGRSLISHILSMHENKGDEKIPATKPYGCTKCPKRFVTRFMFQRHMNFHNLDVIKSLSCHICDLRFYKHQEKELQLHIKTRHTKTSISKLPCQKCDKAFRNNRSLRRHERISHPEIFIYECTECEVKYSKDSYLKTHQIALHSSEDGPYKCIGCLRKKPFDTKEQLIVHLRRHTGESYTECPKCSEQFHSRRQLSNHMEEKHPGELDKVEEGLIEIKCKICEKQYSSERVLKAHLAEAHPDGEDNVAAYKGMYGYFKCHLCSDVFTHKNYRTKHIYRTHEKRYWSQCHICGKGMSNDLLKMHLRTHKGLDCNRCRMKFGTPSEVKEHMKEVHNVSGEPPPGNTLKRKRIKKQCENNRKILKERGMRKRQIPSFPCPLCSKVSCSLHRLNRHLRMVHHEGQQPNNFDCHICGKKFTEQKYLRKHILRCHEFRSVRQCEICGKRLMSKENYDLHIKGHKNQRDFVCYFCKKGFLDKPGLFHHIMVHSGEKPYKCRVCGQRFRMAWGRKSHVRRIHGENLTGNDSYANAPENVNIPEVPISVL